MSDSNTSTGNLITGEAPFDGHARATLRALVGEIIPASAEYGVPGADDDAIFADILRSLVPVAGAARAQVARLDELAQDAGGAQFVALDAATRTHVAEQLHAAGGPSLGAFVTVVAQCYYRDDRVMESLGMEARPPFPKGYEVEQGDWSLLDPVRARPKMYREVP